MEKSNKKILLAILLLSTFLGSLGQLFFKMGLAGSELYLLVGLVAYGLGTMIFLYVLGRAHLSWTYGIGGLSYVFASILAFFLLKEPISAVRWAGILVITIGTVLVGIS